MYKSTSTLVFTLGVLLQTHTSLAVQGPWEQCGGQNWNGGTTCQAGWTCVYSNPWYSQCLQASTSSQPSNPTSTSTKVQGPWEQCGGQDWKGGTTCQQGWTCVYSNPWYSQCLQASSSPVATQTSATSTTKISTSASSSTSTKVQGPWEQCGGQDWTGGTTCQQGWTCVYSNPWYSQCLQASSSNPQSTAAATTTTSVQPASSSTTTIPPVGSSTTTSKTSTSTSPASTDGNIGPAYNASMTHYGAGDTFGSPNCNTNTAACAFYTYPGFSAAVSENLYGVGPGAGAGPACGTCWRVTGYTDSNGNRLSNYGTNIVVMVNNLCPRQGNPLCAQGSLSDTNQYGANVNFDLCSDSGAQAAFFGNSGVGLAVGIAQQVDCRLWSGTVVY